VQGKSLGTFNIQNFILQPGAGESHLSKFECQLHLAMSENSFLDVGEAYTHGVSDSFVCLVKN
jgi:hypothetical protein